MAGPEFKNGYKKGYEDGANSVEEGLPGWFGTFADMMTLLFAFFVLMFSMATMDPAQMPGDGGVEGEGAAEEQKKIEEKLKGVLLPGAINQTPRNQRQN